ncbi:MAG: cytochrome c biogenesis protein CcsA [Oligoflexus sp.]
MNLYHIGVIIALVAFAIASGLYLHSFATNRTQEKLHLVAYGHFIFATCLMTSNTVNAFLYNIITVTSSFVLITASAWITIFAQIFFRVRVLASIVAPLSTLIMLIQFFFVEPHGRSQGQAPSGLMTAHIITSVVGEAFAIVAFGIAVFYLLQQRALKKKQLNRLQHTQISISKLNQALIVSIWVGFILLTAGLILGAIYSQFYYVGDRGELLGKIFWAILVWLWYLATLICRNMLNVPAKRLAWMTIIGFLLLAVGLFGIHEWS